MEKELVELYEAVRKSADVAISSNNEREEARCIEALELLKKFPVDYQILVSTQVGKHLKHLTKHPRKKIRAMTCDLIKKWKEIIIKETCKNKNGNLDNNGETAKARKQKTPSVKSEKVVKAENVKVEKIVSNCTSMSDDTKQVVQNAGVKIEKTDSAANDNVEKMIARDKKQVSGEKIKVASPAAPPKLKTMIKTNDVMRGKIRESLVGAFSKDPGEADEKNSKIKLMQVTLFGLLSQWSLYYLKSGVLLMGPKKSSIGP